MAKQLAILCLSVLIGSTFAAGSSPVVFENSNFRFVISDDGKNVEFVDRASGTNYLSGSSPCASIRVRGKEYAATNASLIGDRLKLGFAVNHADAVIKTETNEAAIVLRVESVSSDEIEALTFLNIPLTLKGVPGEKFGACALALNLQTRVDALPALQSILRASAEKKFGVVGARAAIVAAPMSQILPALQATLSKKSELPVCKSAGPWAREVEFNHGSYLFNFGSLTESNLDSWIDMVHSVGFTQIDNHGGGSFFRFGDMELDKKKWPEGWTGWQRIVSRLHATNIGSIFHTYAFFIDKRSKYVTPVPDPRLDAFRSFTLTAPLDDGTNEIPVNESTADIRTITGFFEHNSIVLHIGNELVTFSGASKEAPWKFTGVKRGALGTTASAHAAGEKARHLKECFGLFVPNVETSLFSEIASNHAYVVNLCGFDGIYLDAIDGSSILRGDDEAWYWASKFVVEIERQLKKPVGMEMSSMWHLFWQYRTRWQAWDYPQRGHKRFVDLHAEGINGGLLLPLHLGWWSFQAFNPPQIEPSYPDVIENLGAKLIGWNAGISLTAGVDREALRKTPLFERAADILRICEDLRHAHRFSEATRAKLREPGKEFALTKDADGQQTFRRLQSISHKTALAEPWTLAWQITNNFAAQPVRFRIEALMSVAPKMETNSILLTDLSKSQDWRQTSADGVNARLVTAGEQAGQLLALVATNTGKVPQKAAWIRFDRTFSPMMNLKAKQGLSVEIEGDGSGALLAIRQESPQHLSFGAAADRYVTLDFTGRRRYSLVETESTRWSDYEWNDKKSLYNLYRETIDFASVESCSIWMQNIPSGRESKCRIGPVYAVPLQSAALKNPRVTVDGKTIEFPVTLESGSWIEANRSGDCEVYGAKGESLGKVTPRGDWPNLRPGVNDLKFSCESEAATPARGQVTVFSFGEML